MKLRSQSHFVDFIRKWGSKESISERLFGNPMNFVFCSPAFRVCSLLMSMTLQPLFCSLLVRDPTSGCGVLLSMSCMPFVRAGPIHSVNCVVFVTSLSDVCHYMCYSMNESRNNPVLSAEQTALSLPCQFIHEVVGAGWESSEQSFGLIKSKVIEINEWHCVELLLRGNCFDCVFLGGLSWMHPRVWHAAGQRLEGDGGHPQQGACHVLALCLSVSWKPHPSGHWKLLFHDW